MKGLQRCSDATTRLNSLPGITRAGSMGVISGTERKTVGPPQ